MRVSKQRRDPLPRRPGTTLTSCTNTSRTLSLHRPGSVNSNSDNGTFTSCIIWRMTGFLSTGNMVAPRGCFSITMVPMNSD